MSRSAAFIQGRDAGLSSLTPGVNPYREGSAEAMEWQRGMQSAQQAVNDYADVMSRRDLLGKAA